MEVRPSHEVTPMGAADVAEMKVHEHVIAAAEKERLVAAKREELRELRRQVGGARWLPEDGGEMEEVPT